MDDENELAPVEKLNAAVQEFVNATSLGGGLVMSWAITWELVRYDDDGDELHRMDYSSWGGGMATALGLMHAGRRMVERDTIGDEGEHDEPDE